MKPKSFHLRWLSAILLLYLLLGLAYSVVVPLGESPDEADHFRYVQYLAQEKRFPLLSPLAEANVTMEANQPPLFYALAAAVTGWVDMAEPADFRRNSCFSFDPNDPGRQHFYLHGPEEQFPYRGTFLAFHLARLLALLLGAGTVWLAYALGQEISYGSRRVGLLAAALLAFNPQFIFISASVNNDVLTALLGAAVVSLSVVALKRPARLVYAGLGLVVGLGLLTKFALLALWPVAVLAAVVPALTGRRQSESIAYRPLLINLFFVVGLPIALAGWWYWRTHQLYGDPLAWTVHLQAKGEQVLRQSPFSGADLVEFVRLHFQSYWALFGWLNVAVPDWIYVVLAAVTLLALLGLAWEAGDGLRQALRSDAPVDKMPLLLTVVAVASIYVSLLRYIQTINWSGYQGRLAFAVAAPIAALLATGLMALPRRLGVGGTPAWLVAAPVGLLLLAIASLVVFVAPAYARPAIYQPNAALPRTCARFAGGVALEAFEVPDRLRPGEMAPVTVYGFGLANSGGAQRLRLQVSGRDGVPVGAAETVLSWRTGEVVSATLLIPIAADAEPARALLQAGLLAAPGEWQAATSSNGRALHLPISLATAKIPPRQPLAPMPEHVAEATFGDEMRLLGYDVAAGDGAFTVTLYWQSLSSTVVDFTTFAHLLDSSGRLVSQDDSQPQAGAYPTSIWDAGEVVADVKYLQRPSSSPGSLQLAVGVYEPGTLLRLPVHNGDGSPQTNNLLILPIRLEGAAES